MNIQKQIDNIIQVGRERGRVTGCEVHHIVMRSLGGLDIEENLVPLLPREHYEIHKLYWQRNTNCEKSALAFLFMSDQHRIQTGEEYESARKLVRKKAFERNGWIDNILWHPNYGRITLSPEFNTQAFMDEYMPEKSNWRANISKVLCGKIPHLHSKTWRLADSGLYLKVKNKIAYQYKTLTLKNITTDQIITINRETQNKFYEEYGIPKGRGYLQQMSTDSRPSQKDKNGHKWVKIRSN